MWTPWPGQTRSAPPFFHAEEPVGEEPHCISLAVPDLHRRKDGALGASRTTPGWAVRLRCGGPPRVLRPSPPGCEMGGTRPLLQARAAVGGGGCQTRRSRRRRPGGVSVAHTPSPLADRHAERGHSGIGVWGVASVPIVIDLPK